MEKIKLLAKAAKDNKVDAVVVLSDQNRLWATGFASSAGMLFVYPNGKADFLLDGRYIEKAKKEVKGPKVLPYKPAEYVKKNKLKKVAVESEYTTLEAAANLEKLGLKVVPFASVPLRAVKTKEEVAKIKKAIDISSRALRSVIKAVKPGMTEKQIGNLLSSTMLSLGAEKDAFDAIVASGENGAYPHHRTSDRKVKDGEFITIDFGCVYGGFRSDITRTFLLGKEPKGNGIKVKGYYDIVKKAQAAGVAAVKAGATGKHVDEVTRKVIKDAGFDFAHGTGHGLGIDVHEQPYVSFRNEKPLAAGNVVTVEPGIYIPGVGGVRIEDDVLVTATGRVNLSQGLEKI